MTIRELLLAPSARVLVVGGGALVAVAAAMLAREADPPIEAPAVEIEAREPVAAAAHREVALEDEARAPEAADPRASLEEMNEIRDPADFAFVVAVGGKRYLDLSRLSPPEEPAVAGDRDRAVLVHDDYVTSAVVPLAAGELPEELRRWRGRRVLVGGTCAATVTGFAEIARVSGDAFLAIPEGEEPRLDMRWTVETAFSHGSTMIAGELDGGCDGDWARAADRPAVGHPIAVADAGAERAARVAFLASYAEDIAAGWREAEQEGDWQAYVPLDVQLVENSLTGARWAYVHANQPGGCGDHGVNVAALYQVREDGALTEIDAGELPGRLLNELVDLNGDGWFERIVVDGDPSDLSLLSPTGSAGLAEIDVPLHGCGC